MPLLSTMKSSVLLICFVFPSSFISQCASLQPQVLIPPTARSTASSSSSSTSSNSSSSSSNQEIMHLVEKSAFRQRGSKQYQKAWRYWLKVSVDAIRNELMQRLPAPVNSCELEDLSFALGVAADAGEMPSFAASGARSGYALDYFCRVHLLADLLMMDETNNPTLPDYWKEDVMQRHSLWGGRNHMDTENDDDGDAINVMSLGGGPGYDFCAVALVASFRGAGISHRTAPINATVLDYEPGWSSLVHAMQEATTTMLLLPSTTTRKKKMTCQWGGSCDITKPLHHASNADCLVTLASTSLFTCQYCVAENANQLKKSGYIFFRNLFETAASGSLFIFTEVTPRLWPDFYQIVVELNEETKGTVTMKIGFPNIRGPQMTILKTADDDKNHHRGEESFLSSSSPVIKESDLELLQHFENYSQKQEEKMKTGWTRTMSKQHLRRTRGFW